MADMTIYSATHSLISHQQVYFNSLLHCAYCRTRISMVFFVWPDHLTHGEHATHYTTECVGLNQPVLSYSLL